MTIKNTSRDRREIAGWQERTFSLWIFHQSTKNDIISFFWSFILDQNRKHGTCKNAKAQVSLSPYFSNYGDLIFPLLMNIYASVIIPIFLVIIKTSSSKAIKTWTGRTPHPEQQKSNNRWGSHIRPRLLLTAGKTISPLRLNSKNCSPLQHIYKICQSPILTLNVLSYQ